MKIMQYHYYCNLMCKQLLTIKHASLILFFSLIILNLPAQTSFQAKLSGNQEALPVLTTATGMVTAEVMNDSLIVEGSFSGLAGNFNVDIVGGAHIHLAYAGSNGDIVFPLNTTIDQDSLGGTFEADSNKFALDAGLLSALETRQFYVNIHSRAFPSGELRGQLLPVSDAFYGTNLFGSNEVPSIISSASGAVVAELAGDQLVITGSFSGLESGFNEAVGAHIHVGPAGRNGPVIIPLVPTIDTTDTGGIFAADENTFTLTQGQIDTLDLRQLYVNIHSDNIASGEIRGQLRPLVVAAFRVHLSGTNEVPSVTTSATGELVVEWLDSTYVLTGSFNNLESPLATDIVGGVHIHGGLAGTNAGIEEILTPSTDNEGTSGIFLPEDNTFPINDTITGLNVGRSLYVNIHSENNRGGELRGQILPESQYFFTTALTGTQEVPTALTAAYGNVVAEVLGENVTVSGSFSGLQSDFNVEIVGGAHIHLAPAGSNGPVEFILNSEIDPSNRAVDFLPDSNSFSLSTTQLDTLRDRLNYVNIHSIDLPGGEIRGQLVHEATAYYVAPLSGTSEVDLVNSAAIGTVILEQTGDQIIASGSFNDLSSDLATDIVGGAHIHFNIAGSNGPVRFVLNSDQDADLTSGVFPVDSNIFALAEGQLDTIRSREAYVNIHSLNFGPGEIRGQLLPQAVSFLTATLQGSNEVPPIVSAANGALKFELSGNILIASGSFAGLESPFNEQIGGGAHLHIEAVGQNGPVAIPLSAIIPVDSLSGVFLADSNTFELDSAQLESVRAERFYVNIHTDSIPSGEIRGQVLKESNFFPGDSAMITAPEDGAIITLAGLPTLAFTPEWTAVEDPDDNLVGYIWQLAATDTFGGSTVVNAAVGADLSFTTSLGFVDTLLQSVGLQIGDSITLFHRAVATDGSVSAEGSAASVTIVRGIVSSIQNQLPQGYEFAFYPSPVKNSLMLEMVAPQSDQLSIKVIDMVGRTLADKDWNIQSGTNRDQLDVSSYSPGAYIIQLFINDEVVGAEKFIKE